MPKKFSGQTRRAMPKRKVAALRTPKVFASRCSRLQLTPMIEPPGDKYFVREALRHAQKAYEAGEVPVGAVVVREGRIIARAYNQVELLKDATAHAEMLALTQAEAAVGDWRLTECDLCLQWRTKGVRSALHLACRRTKFLDLAIRTIRTARVAATPPVPDQPMAEQRP